MFHVTHLITDYCYLFILVLTGSYTERKEIENLAKVAIYVWRKEVLGIAFQYCWLEINIPFATKD